MPELIKSQEILKFFYLPVKELVPYVRNANIHPPEQVRLIAEWIKKVGFLNPVLIDKNNELITGHGRILAAELLGLEKVPCLFAEHLTPEQIKAYRLADNYLAELSHRDNELVKVELKELKDMGFKEMDSLGFDEMEKELDSIRDDENPELPKKPEKKDKPEKPVKELPNIPGLAELNKMYIDQYTFPSRNPYKFISIKRMKEPDFDKLKAIKAECNPEIIKYLAGQCTELLLQTYLSFEGFSICPAPQGSKAKMNKKHFATEIAKEIAKILNIQVAELFKPGYKPTFGTNNKSLASNIIPDKIIFFDDILTTGTTLINCLSLLKNSFVIPLVLIDNR
jgi:hypothetical protein